MKKGKKLGTTKDCVTRSCSVAEIVINSEDLLTEILLRLPVKSLVKFMCVSKQWHRLISDSNFASLHTRRNPNFVSSALILSNLKLFSLPNPKSSAHPKQLSFLMPMRNRRIPLIADSRNGLLLCQQTSMTTSGAYKRYIVCNPTTQDLRLLPSRKDKHNYPHVCLVFDPSKSPHFLVVEACFDEYYAHSCEIEIYQSELDTWIQGLKFDIPRELGLIHRRGSFWNGALHWIGEFGYHILFDPYSKVMRGFKMPVHPRILPDSYIRYFGECAGRLFLIQTRNRKKPGFNVLEMGGDNRSWLATYRVNLRGLVEDVPRIGENLKSSGFDVLSIVKGGKREDLSLVLQIRENMVSYGLQTKKWVVLDDLGDCSKCYPFIESMTPVCR